MNLHDDIIKYTKYIKLPETRKMFKIKAEEAINQNLSYEEYLHSLLEQEYYRRIENRKAVRIRSAKFPHKKYLQDLDLDYLPEDGRVKLKALKTLDF